MKIKLRRTEKQDTCNDEDGEIYGITGTIILNTDDGFFVKDSTVVDFKFPYGQRSYWLSELNEDIKNGYLEHVKEPCNDNQTAKN